VTRAVRSTWIAAALATAGAACTVPGLDYTGKSCPCADGWVCEAATNTCVAVASADGPTGDGSRGDAPIGAPDAAQVATSCFGTPPGAVRLVEHFDTFTGWTIGGGNWAANSGELVQSSPNASLSYAYPTALVNLTDYRVVTKMRQINGGIGDAMEISFRTQRGGTDGQYHCNWEPDDGGFLLQYTAPNANTTDVLTTITIPIGTIPNYDPLGQLTMELQVVGSQISCCMHDIPGASIIAVDTRYVSGGPGLKTYKMATAYDDYTVYDP